MPAGGTEGRWRGGTEAAAQTPVSDQRKASLYQLIVIFGVYERFSGEAKPGRVQLQG